jgi:septal ring factor EnvC (AmiA/AmiB activator)
MHRNTVDDSDAERNRSQQLLAALEAASAGLDNKLESQAAAAMEDERQAARQRAAAGGDDSTPSSTRVVPYRAQTVGRVAVRSGIASSSDYGGVGHRP